MKASLEEQQALIDLVEVDRELGRLTYALRTLPVYGELEAAESALGVAQKQAKDHEAARPAIETTIADCGAKVEQLNASIARKQGQLDSGENMDSRQLLVLQGDIDGLKAMRGDTETLELEAMEELEALEEQLAEDARQIDQATATRDALVDRKTTEVRDLEGQIAEVRARRSALAATSSPNLVDAYDESRSMGGAGVVVMTSDGTVDGGLDLSLTEFEKIKSLPDDEVYVTEEGAVVVKG